MVKEERRKKSKEEREMSGLGWFMTKRRKGKKRVRSIYKNAPPSLFLFLFQAA